MLDIRLPTGQQGSQDAVSDPRSLLFPFLSQIMLGGRVRGAVVWQNRKEPSAVPSCARHCWCRGGQKPGSALCG